MIFHPFLYPRLQKNLTRESSCSSRHLPSCCSVRCLFYPSRTPQVLRRRSPKPLLGTRNQIWPLFAGRWPVRGLFPWPLSSLWHGKTKHFLSFSFSLSTFLSFLAKTWEHARNPTLICRVYETFLLLSPLWRLQINFPKTKLIMAWLCEISFRINFALENWKLK